MRDLTLDEKISFKGLLFRKGIVKPGLDIKDLLFYWSICFGIQITKWNNDKANIPKKYKNSKFYYDFYYKNYVKKGKAYENNTT